MRHCYYTLFFITAFLFSNQLKAQSMFDVSVVHTVEINFYDANWDFKLDSLAALTSGTGSGTGRILADITINGTAFDSCGVRYKGNSSQDAASEKNPFNIDLNYIIVGQEYQGKDKIKLANCYTDPSMVREALTYELANRYMDCPRGSFTKVFTNGVYRGIYTNTESVDNEFLAEHYGSSNNPFFKCDPNSFELFGDNSNLAYHSDTMAYDTLYHKKSLYGLTELQTLTYNLEFNAANIEQHLDVDRALWFLAISSAFVHNDGYTAFGHNYYVYQQDNGIWSIILWDVNMSFGGLVWNGTGFLPLSENALQTQDPFLHMSATNFRPLIAQLLSIPKYNRMYVAHYRTILEENVTNGHYIQRAQFMSDLIDADRQNEVYNEYTYQQFQDNLTTNVGSGFNLRVGLSPLMTARETYLYGITEFQATRPSFANETTNPLVPLPFTLVTFNTDATNATSVWLGYRYNQFDAFTKVLMYDDGAHNDGASGDGTYGVDATILGTDMQYYFYAENATSGRFSPARAEYEFHLLSPEKGLVINELSASNISIATDLNGDYDDWIEVYNGSNDPINLGDYFLSDDGGNLLKWNFPNYTLQPDEYFIVWADNELAQSGVHANFKLASSGEGLYLSDNLGFTIDFINYPQQFADITYGRLPNGTGPFDYLYPTFGTQNSTAVGEEEELIALFNVYPNPAEDVVNIQFDSNSNDNIFIYDLSGKLIELLETNGSQLITFDVSNFESGIYLLSNNKGLVKKLVVR